MATILIVDDRKLDRELLITLLEYTRYRVVEATNGAEALQFVRSERPDLVISDVLLPEMDGYELVRRMRTDPTIVQPAVIFYTAVFNEQEARGLARECGVARVLAKPTDPKEILDTVAEVLRADDIEDTPSLPADFGLKHRQLLVQKLMQQVDALRHREEALQRQSDLLKGINTVLRETILCETEEEVAKTCLSVAEELTGSEFGFIGEIDRKGLFYDIALSDPGWAACRMPESETVRLIHDMEIRGIWGRVLEDGKPLIAIAQKSPF